MDGSKAKGIVILHEIPNMCEPCPFIHYDLDRIDVMCLASDGDHYLNVKKWGKEKPKWCPIHEVDTSKLEVLLKGKVK